MSRLRPYRSILAILGAGLLLRIVLAFVVFPGQGYASDLGLFETWAATLARVGPSHFYETAPSANYPPAYLYVVWLIGSLATPVGSLIDSSPEGAILLLLKVPAIAADLGIAVLLYVAARRWFGERPALVAAALYLFVPVTWYDSAVWGQVDAVGALVMLAAILLLIDGWSEPAAALSIVGFLVKPQDAICLVVVAPVLLRRHLIRVGTGPQPSLGAGLTRLDGRLGGLLTAQGPVRLGTSALSAAVVGILVLLPFDMQQWAPPALADVPVVSHIAGLIGLVVTVAGQFDVLTANAYNAWALVGAQPLAAVIGGSGATWTPDSVVLLGGLSAVAIGTILLGLIGILVAAGLLARDGRLPILLGFTLLAVAFYVLPTRVHERYLFPTFASGALLAAAGASRAVGYLGLGGLNLVNLHAVLAAPLAIRWAPAMAPGAGSIPNTGFGGGGLGAGGGFGGGAGDGGASWVRLPLADLARNEQVVVAVALGQTLALLVLLVAWLALLIRPRSALWRPAWRRMEASRRTG